MMWISGERKDYAISGVGIIDYQLQKKIKLDAYLTPEKKKLIPDE